MRAHRGPSWSHIGHTLANVGAIEGFDGLSKTTVGNKGFYRFSITAVGTDGF